MMSLVEVFFQNVSDEQSEFVIAELTLIGYETFWHDEDGLRAYVKKTTLDEAQLEEVCKKYNLKKYAIQNAKAGEWDRVKEEFDPFVIANKVTVQCDHSSTSTSTPYTLIMDAQMAFGTGKHPSTELCVKAMLNQNFESKTVLDVGTGSGILAILSEKLGALQIHAFDNNPWAVEVAAQLIESNDCQKITISQNDIDGELLSKKHYDIVLANLNFDVLKTELPKLFGFLKKDGFLLVSGVMIKDVETVVSLTKELSVALIMSYEMENWSCMLFKIIDKV